MGGCLHHAAAALLAASAGDEIWVAEGTYKPTSGADRTVSFQMRNEVAIYGGFDPTVGDIAWEDRDWEANATILSGDLAGNDGPDFANNGENSYHVFHHPEGTNLDHTAILDGFTISGGNANGVWPHVDGGGMRNYEYSSPTLANCTFAGNLADYGGGMYNLESSPTLTGCTFAGNSADHGGGMYNLESSPTLTGCTFAGNSAEWRGGGMRNKESSPVLTDCTFSGNSASDGGGMFNDGSAPTLTNCAFSGNSAEWRGGGMWNQESSPALTNCTFEDNTAQRDGGGMFNEYISTPTLTNCTFAGNSAYDWGGGMYNEYNSSPTLTNCTFAGNEAWLGGGGMYNYSSTPTLTNCILWADSPDEVENAGSTPSVTYSDVQGGYTGTGNINADPLFVDPGSGDFHLAPGSPCIDAGSNEAPNPPAYDFEGDLRIVDGDRDGAAIVDMGVDEALLRLYLPMVVRNW